MFRPFFFRSNIRGSYVQGVLDREGLKKSCAGVPAPVLTEGQIMSKEGLRASGFI